MNNNNYINSLEITDKDTPDTPSKYRLLTRRQTAERFGVHKETIKRWQKNGTLPAIIINSRVTRYDPVVVERKIKEGTVA
jgi:hypothetical protein